ncbi:MAG TPA: dephospho-CoA kinase [Hyphomicrobiaceae bacterium]|nr:dephospho-CoA kinase [Hyphomicrobiaceae bacterium]
MLVIGLTGSIGMGKSTVAARLRSLGIAVFDADAEVHRLYEGAAVARIEAAFPGTTDGHRVDRQKLSVALIAKPQDFQRLEAIVHPLVFAAERAFLRQQAEGGAKLAVLEVPLLLESHRQPRLDAIIVVSTRADLQRERVLRRPGMSVEKLEQVLTRQMPDAEKRARADYVVDTGGTFAETDAQVDRIVESLQHRKATAYQEFWA